MTVFTLAPQQRPRRIQTEAGITRPMTLTVSNSSATLVTAGGIHYELNRVWPDVLPGIVPG